MFLNYRKGSLECGWVDEIFALVHLVKPARTR